MSVINKIKTLLVVEDRPERISLSFSIGLFIGLSPLLGIHTLLALLVASLLRLNRFAMLTGVYVTNPWTLIPIYTFSTWLGTEILAVQDIFKPVDFSEFHILNLFKGLKALLLPFVVGSFVVATGASLVAYFLMLKLLHRLKRID